MNFHCEKEGGMIFSLGVALVAMALLLAYIFNLSSELIEREKMQHAADSAAYSSAVWMARGMNTIASINHSIGEQVAFCIALEAFGGPEANGSAFEPCREERNIINEAKMAGTSYCSLSPNPYIKGVESRIVNTMVDWLKDGKNYAAAACYDAKLTLKYYMIMTLRVKMAGTILINLGKTVPWLRFLIPIGLALHASVEYYFLKAFIEYPIILVMEQNIRFLASAKKILYYSNIEENVQNAQKIAGETDSTVYDNIKTSMEELKNTYKFENYCIASSKTHVPDELGDQRAFLPLCREKTSNTKGKVTQNRAVLKNSPWVAGINSPYKELPEIPIDGLNTDIFDTTTARQAVKDAQSKNDAQSRKKRKKARGAISNATNQINQMSSGKYGPDTKWGFSNNPSVWSYPSGCFDYTSESVSQWVRASYPVVDVLRDAVVNYYTKGSRNSFKLDSEFAISNNVKQSVNGTDITDMDIENRIKSLESKLGSLVSFDVLGAFGMYDLSLSGFTTWYSGWVYRYALSESYYFRTHSNRPYSNNPMCRKECFLYVIPGTVAENKGNEMVWTDMEYGAPLIDEMFTVTVAISAKKHKPQTEIKSRKENLNGNENDGTEGATQKRIFVRRGEDNCNITVAQAMFYPATGRNSKGNGTLKDLDNDLDYQPLTAWDTLQWKNYNPGGPPIFEALEWYNPPTTNYSESLSFTDLFSNNRVFADHNGTRRMFSWHAMLCPVSQAGLRRLAEDSNAERNMSQAVQHAADSARLLVH